jgi:hypothetical protein
MKQRFILIDQSIQHLGGHHYEYAVRVLEAAERAGLEPILVTNRQVSVGAHTRFRVVPAYLYAFWDHPRRFSLVRRLAALFRVRANALDRFKFRLLFSPVGIAYIERERLLDWLRRRSFSHDVSSFSRIAILSVAGVIKLLQTILGTLKLLMPFQSYFSRVFSVLGGIPRSMVALGSQLRSRLGAPEFMGMSARKVRQFRKDTLRLMSLIGAHPGDCFFVPTLNEASRIRSAAARRVPRGTSCFAAICTAGAIGSTPIRTKRCVRIATPSSDSSGRCPRGAFASTRIPSR